MREGVYMVKKNDILGIDDILNEDNPDEKSKKYNKYVDNITPKHCLCKNIIRAFIVGAIICM